DEPVYSFTADDLQGFFIERGFGDLFPAWSEDDIQTITEDGKIPVYDRWSGQLHEEQIALDALMSQSGLRSFAADQAALDGRIEAQLD
ncbi:MAG: hypothetical protein PVH50_02430, partial [Anaerolineae bacterium]